MSLLSSFRGDPFFSGVDLPQTFEQRSRSDKHDRQLTQYQQNNNDRELDIFGNPFGFMNTMVGNMNQMMRQMESRINSNDFPPNGQGVSFSSSTVMSMDNRNGTQPRIIQATSEKLQGPEGFSRTRKAVRDTGRNLEKMEIAHRLGQRGHRITKERDPSSGQLLENRDFEYIEDENQFEREWFDRAGQLGLKNFNGHGFNSQANNLLMTPPSFGRLRSQSQEPRHMAIEHEQSNNYNSRSKQHRHK
ncbi:unnamed protein product [Rotaria magnacalcarata]|uniref:Myeloid leukemia factor n=1 Tax=Rotaria magnacalcarata TaxID=392030 RepID=A0A816X503_9BILA|nr:unnamed protein product [Rotaria magnacalcarata]CAF4057137.1 unnamed protein product [Rotaria magnacalcarata]